MLRPAYLAAIAEGSEQIASELHDYIVQAIVGRMMERIGRGEKYLLTSADRWRPGLIIRIRGYSSAWKTRAGSCGHQYALGPPALTLPPISPSLPRLLHKTGWEQTPTAVMYWHGSSTAHVFRSYLA